MGIDLEKWGRLASNNSAVAKSIQEACTIIKESEEEIADDFFATEITGMQERAAEVISNNPEFTKKLFYIFFGGAAEERISDEEPLTGMKSKVESKEHGKDKTKLAKKLLKNFTADEIKGLCRNRYSLMSMEDFLLLLNKLNSASSGKLLQDK